MWQNRNPPKVKKKRHKLNYTVNFGMKNKSSGDPHGGVGLSEVDCKLLNKMRGNISWGRSHPLRPSWRSIALMVLMAPTFEQTSWCAVNFLFSLTPTAYPCVVVAPVWSFVVAVMRWQSHWEQQADTVMLLLYYVCADAALLGEHITWCMVAEYYEPRPSIL